VSRELEVATGKLALIGANEFPDLGEAPVGVLDMPQIPVTPTRAILQVKAMAPIRLAQPFEALRNASDRMLAATGVRPRIFLANLGASADFTAPATFAKNFFAAGGIEAVGEGELADHEALVAAFRRSRRPSRLPLCVRRDCCCRRRGCCRCAAKGGRAPHLYGRPAEGT